MKSREGLWLPAALILMVGLLLPMPALARQRGAKQSGQEPDVSCTIIVMVRDETGGAGSQPALVEVSRMEGGVFSQQSTQAGQVQITNLRTGLYTVKVSMSGYETSQQTLNVNGGVVIAQFQMRPMGDAKANAQRPKGMPILAPKAQKLADQVWSDLRDHKLASAYESLVELYRLAPAHPEVNYLYGLYESRLGDHDQAKVYWQKTLQIYPKHMGALLQLSQASVHENKPEDALPLLNQAMEVDPAAWRPHAIMVEVFLQQKMYPEAVKEADRALDLGHKQADEVLPLQAHALAVQGDTGRAIQVLQNYLQDHADNVRARKMLDALQATPPAPATSVPPSDLPLLSASPSVRGQGSGHFVLALSPPVV